MANLRLKKLVLEIVENQLRDNDPPAAKQAYQKLIDAGYTAKEAKEKIGAVVLTEIYDVMKENQAYDEKRYQLALEEMVQQCLDFEDTHDIPKSCFPLQLSHQKILSSILLLPYRLLMIYNARCDMISYKIIR